MIKFIFQKSVFRKCLLLCISTERAEVWMVAKPKHQTVQPSTVISSETGVARGVEPVMSCSGHPDSSSLLAGNNTSIPKGMASKNQCILVFPMSF